MSGFGVGDAFYEGISSLVSKTKDTIVDSSNRIVTHRKLKFQTKLRIFSLENVPLPNGKQIYCKVKVPVDSFSTGRRFSMKELLNGTENFVLGPQRCQSNAVYFFQKEKDTLLEFERDFYVDKNNVLQDFHIRISVRMDGKTIKTGGRQEFTRLGVIVLNLAEHASAHGMTRHNFLLAESTMNSVLHLGLEMKQSHGDPLFICPGRGRLVSSAEKEIYHNDANTTCDENSSLSSVPLSSSSSLNLNPSLPPHRGTNNEILTTNSIEGSSTTVALGDNTANGSSLYRNNVQMVNAADKKETHVHRPKTKDMLPGYPAISPITDPRTVLKDSSISLLEKEKASQEKNETQTKIDDTNDSHPPPLPPRSVGVFHKKKKTGDVHEEILNYVDQELLRAKALAQAQ
eukprot:g4257.t1